jgi:hypothetical protein
VDVVLRREGGVWVEDEFHPIAVTKRLGFAAELPRVDLAYEIEHAAPRSLSLWFACESSFVLSAGAGEDRHYRFEGSEDTPPLDSTGTHEATGSVALVDDWLGCQVRLRLGEPTLIWTFPLLTVSQGLEGPTRSYQGSCVTASWRLELPPREPWRTSMAMEVTHT